MGISPRPGPIMVFLGVFLGLASLASASSIAMTYCASLLTADSGSANASTYQSDGLCYDFCESDYAFAIVQEKNCWCSNYAPASSLQVDTSECNTECPGYPADTCGGSGLYGYMQLAKSPSGTQGADTTTAAAATTTTQGTVVTQTVQNTVTVDPTTSPTTTETSTSESPATTKESAATSTADPSTADPTTSASPTTFVSTITQGGSVTFQTVTVIPTVAGSSETSASAANVSTGQKGLSTGAAVGTAVGVLGFVVIIIAAGFFFWFRRKRRADGGTMLEHQDSFRGSSAGMMGTPRTEMASVWEGESQSVGRRSSRLMPHDPRMDPYAMNIYGRFDNKSHESINTLRDDQDYSRRVLRTTNPDPTAG
ncbi:hypothetical protein AB5N19_10837 [Seiridium cardinale]|uniref:WSC domain-containing protein n=1 Tax=Seiridium cardinale TaxID=138064 RepID=A0ABR2XME4_9PEZI